MNLNLDLDLNNKNKEIPRLLPPSSFEKCPVPPQPSSSNIPPACVTPIMTTPKLSLPTPGVVMNIESKHRGTGATFTTPALPAASGKYSSSPSYATNSGEWKLRPENQLTWFDMKNAGSIAEDSPRDVVMQRALDDPASHHALEIVRLRKELERTRSEKNAVEDGLRVRLAASQEHAVYLEAKVYELEHRHKHEASGFEHDYRNEIQKLKSTISHLEQKAEQLQTSKVKMEESLNAELTDARASISSRKEEITTLTETIERMKVYQSEYCGIDWEAEKGQMENLIKESIAAREYLDNDNKLLSVRLESMNEILTMQERQVSRIDDQAVNSKQDPSTLLTRWRGKVFDLMIQLKSTNISSEKDTANYKLQLAELNGSLGNKTRNIEMLNLVIKDREAELQIEKNRNKCLEAEMTRVQQLALMLDDQAQQDRHSCQRLTDYAECLVAKFADLEDTYRRCNSSLASHNQRLSFASNRLVMLQGQLARREARLKFSYDEPEQSHITKSLEDSNIAVYDRTSQGNLMNELARVTAERDQLIRQMKEDSQQLEDRLRAPRLQYEADAIQMKERISELENLLAEKIKLCESLECDLESVRREPMEARRTIEKSLADEQLRQALEEQATELRGERENEILEMDRRLKDTRREYMKTAMTLRQLEHPSRRDKDLLTERAPMSELNCIHNQQYEINERETRSTDHSAKLNQERQGWSAGAVSTPESELLVASTYGQSGVATDHNRGDSNPDTVSTTERYKLSVPKSEMESVLDELEMLTADFESPS